jgi:TonB-dependent starch-binding outer membrane protein SusC
MNRFRWLFALAFAVAVMPSTALAQERGTIAGTVTDQTTQQPLAGAQIQIAGTQLGTITNQQGRFIIPNVPTGQQTVRVTLIGYAQGTQAVQVASGATATVAIRLQPTAVELDQVVVSAVTGQAQRKRELGTNTASISAAELERAPITRMADVLVGRAAGVQLQGVAGTVGTSQRIRIRGANSISLSNEPLIFVDGVQFSNNKGGFAVGGQDYSRLNDLNFEDISNVEILKGPAASAMYGTAAANGVILITTRRGRAGTAQWRAYTEFGRSSDENPYPLNYMTTQVNDASAPMWLSFGQLNRGTAAQVAARTGPYSYCPNEDAARGLCRQDMTVSLNPFTTPGLNPFERGNRQKHGLSVGGGGDALTFYVSGDYDTETGVVSFNSQDRYSLRANVNASVLDNLGINLTASYTRSDLQMIPNDNNIFSPLINGLLASPFVPTEEQRTTVGGPGSRPGTGFGYYMSDIGNNIAFQLVDRYIGGLSANWQPISWLSINSNAGLDYFGRFDQQTIQPGRLPIAATWTPGWRQGQRSNNYIWSMNTAGVASFQLNPDLGSTTTVGAAFGREQFESVYCYGVGLVEGTRSCAATSSLFSVDEGYSQVRNVGAYVQQQLNWRDRLIVSGSIRGDDDSAFGQDFGLIYYPGVSASWVLSEEPFFPQTAFLSNLRLRGAYGMSGQRPGSRDAVTLLDPVSAAVGGQDASAVRLRSVGNPNLKPERTTEVEGGFDMGLLQDRVSVEFTYFNKQSRDALIRRPLPPSFGLTGDNVNTGAIWENLGSIRNSGTELALNARVLQLPTAALNMRVSATTLQNRIEEMGEGIRPIIFNRSGAQRHQEGFSAGGFWQIPYEIRNAQPGQLLTRDNLFATSDTAIYLGPSLPTNTQSVSADLALFRNLVTFSTLFERRAGNYTFNNTEQFRCNTGFSRAGGSTGNANCAGVADPNASHFEQARFLAMRFGATNPVNANQRLFTVYGYLEPADFIKWREASVTLGVPAQLAQTVSALRGASITFSGRNLATWTDYTGLDPEINESGGTANFTQGEFNTQPPLRYFTVRVNYSF